MKHLLMAVLSCLMLNASVNLAYAEAGATAEVAKPALGVNKQGASVWLQAMNQAMQSLSYQGVATFEHGSELISVAVRHAVIDGKTYERLSHLNDAPREIIRRGDQVSCFHQGRSELRLGVDSGTAVHSRIDVANLQQSYTLALLGQQRVAGRSVAVVELKSKDAYRHGRRLFIDQDSKLLLKSIVFDNKRRPLERFQFVQLDTQAELEPGDFVSPLASSEQAKTVTSAEAAMQPWHIAWLPDGFKQIKKQAEATKAYSDGLAAFTVFVELAQEQLAAKMQRGASLVYSRPLMVGEDTYNVTVVGEITDAAAERIAASIRW